VPPDLPAGGAGHGDGDAGFDGDLVGVGFHRDLGCLASVREADPPALMTWLPRLTLPEAFTVRSTSVTSPDAGGNGGGPAGLAPAAVPDRSA
jgi:hypothetical protein